MTAGALAVMVTKLIFPRTCINVDCVSTIQCLFSFRSLNYIYVYRNLYSRIFPLYKILKREKEKQYNSHNSQAYLSQAHVFLNEKKSSFMCLSITYFTASLRLQKEILNVLQKRSKFSHRNKIFIIFLKFRGFLAWIFIFFPVHYRNNSDVICFKHVLLIYQDLYL